MKIRFDKRAQNFGVPEIVETDAEGLEWIEEALESYVTDVAGIDDIQVICDEDSEVDIEVWAGLTFIGRGEFL